MRNQEVEVEVMHRVGQTRSWLGRLFGRSPQPSASLERPPPAANLASDFSQLLGYTFARAELLTLALTHPSAAVGGDPHYERLEFLGDAVLDLAIADLLMRQFPDAKEGALSKQRASIVNGRTLAVKAQSNRPGQKNAARQGRGKKRRPREDLDSRRGVRGGDRRDLLPTAGSRRRSRWSSDFSSTISADPPPSAITRPNCRKSPIAAFARSRFTNWWPPRGPDHAKRFTTRIRIAGRESRRGRGRQQEAERAGRGAHRAGPNRKREAVSSH